ncbi:tyrosine-type recombinase/integrase [Marilutibacter maris]|uniref:tyrosine-type recombinase/integrase n=1 Tax=Marilutibacter maris TaxID=1605891 RepID=UPI000DAA5D09|nr:integrase arm-type DNA-binding domain-containing protein [Lysobacter maris]
MLTDIKIRSLKSKASVYRVADSNGLCIEVRPSGAKLWRYRYRYNGKATMAPVGAYPAVSLAEARAERDRLRTLLRGGANPTVVARIERAAKVEEAESTFGAVAAELLEKRTREGLSAGSVKRERRLVQKNLAGIVDLPITAITAPVLLSELRKLERRGVVETAHRARGHAGLVFRYAIATGRAKTNPAADLVGALQSTQTMHFASVTDPARIGELLRAIHGYRGTAVVSAAVRLAPLVFVRPGELRNARWADIDLDVAEWRYTASKTNTPHIVPLASQAVEILRELMPLTGRGEFVFPNARNPRGAMSENTINAALRTLGFDSTTISGHGFRAMARTVLDEVLGFRPDFIEHQLAHAVKDPNGRAYNRTAHLDERGKMMQAWADYLDTLRVGVSGNVLSFE